MSRVPHSLGWMLLLVAGSALGATPLEAARAELGEANAQAAGLRTRKESLGRELDQLAGRIEVLKSERGGALLPGQELESSLRRSQELSGALTELATRLQAAEAQVERAGAALASTLSEELARLRAEWERAPGTEARRQLLARMRQLRAELDRLRARTASSALPSAPSSGGSADDPEDLLEQVDALRDSEDKVRKRLAVLGTRIAEAREERELDRRLHELAGEGALFDEHDRRLRLNRDPHVLQFDTTRASDMVPLGASAPETAGMGQTGDPARARAPDGLRTKDSSLDAGDDLENLEAEQARLRSFADQLRAKAQELEARARELR